MPTLTGASTGAIFTSPMGSFNFAAGWTDISPVQMQVRRPPSLCSLPRHRYDTLPPLTHRPHPPARSLEFSTQSGLFYAVGTYDGLTVIAVGDGVIYYSNGNAVPTPTSWVYSQAAVGKTLHCVSFGAKNVAYAGGTFATLIKVRVTSKLLRSYFEVLRTICYGWTCLDHPINRPVLTPPFATLKKTTNGGQTWSSLYSALRTMNAVGINDNIRDRKSTRLNSSHITLSRMPSSA